MPTKCLQDTAKYFPNLKEINNFSLQGQVFLNSKEHFLTSLSGKLVKSFLPKNVMAL